jgi:hypothetical protein
MECAVCLEQNVTGAVVLGCCKQGIHLKCFLKCIKFNEQCPYCRTYYNIQEDVVFEEHTLFLKILGFILSILPGLVIIIGICCIIIT